MQGNLKDMSVADLVQHHCQDRRMAKLSVDHAEDTAEVFFDGGNIVHASLGSRQGEEVIYQILGWDEGTFNVEPDVTPPMISIQRNWPGLLIEGARRLDEQKLEIVTAQPEFEEKDMGTLDDLLKQMSGEIPGYMASVFSGMDGLNLAQHAKVKVNPEMVSAQLALLLKLVDTSLKKLDAGALEDDLVTTENAYVLIRFLPDKNYYLGIAADRKTASLGNMRLISRLYVDRISKAMPH